MSSMMQFTGNTKRNKHGRGMVGLQLIKVKPTFFVSQGYAYHPVTGEFTGYTYDAVQYSEGGSDPVDYHDCTVCGKRHPRIWELYRRPRGMFGCWVVFRYNGSDQVPDLSCPTSVFTMPRDAIRLDDRQSSELWHKG